MAEAADEEELAQWMPDCDDCDNPAEHVCKTCGDKLCGDCKDHHLSKKRTRYHEVVLYSSGLKLPIKKASACSKHPDERCQVYCKPCRSPVCPLCITEAHADFNHAFISIADAFSDAKDKAIANLEKMTKTIRPALRSYTEHAKESVLNAEGKVSEVENDLKRCAQLLHTEVDLILENNLQQLQKNKEENITPVVQAMKQGEILHTKIEQAITEYECYLRSDDPLDLLAFMKEKDSEDPEISFPIPAVKEIPLPKFDHGSIDRRSIQNQLGSLTYIIRKQKTYEMTDGVLDERNTKVEIKCLNKKETIDTKDIISQECHRNIVEEKKFNYKL